ncbi:cation transporter [Polaribacter sp.]|uniref:cation transporter n=1 Tax=Polaribacter sp. TaxID=1920175 RepID=UPI003EF609B7
MKTKKLLFSFVLVCFVFVGCKNEVKKENQVAKKQNVTLAISGMTCEIGCAKTIQSKLSKKEGVLDAKVVFTDSIANIEFDANKTSTKDLIAFVDGIAGGDLYSASESSKKEHVCTDTCKENCKVKGEKKACCSGETKNGKMTCAEDCKMACCADKI